MKVYVYPADTEGCGYYRLIWPSLALKKQGYDVRIIHPKHSGRISGVMDENDRLVSISAPSDADVMVLQRVTSRHMIEAARIWRANGIAVVMDIDDDLSSIDPSNPAWTMLHPKTAGRVEQYSWHSAQKFAEAVTFITVTTPLLLKQYAPHGRGAVLVNCVPEVVTRIPYNPTPNLIGWGGNVRTHTRDPAVVGPAIARLQRDGYDFRIIGPSYKAKSAFTLDREPDVTGGVSLAQWHHQLSKLSVGIAPLADTRFNHAKSWLKMLEYAALGVPCVGSPSAEYRRLHAQGIGLLADSPKEWYRHIRRLLTDDALRQTMSEQGRAIVAAQYTIEANAWRWWEAWQTALRIQRGSSDSPFKRPLSTTTGQNKRGPQTS